MSRFLNLVSCLGLVSAIRYELGIAKEGVDFTDAQTLEPSDSGAIEYVPYSYSE